MEGYNFNPAHHTGFIEKKEISRRRPEDIIAFLREFNFGNRDESARVAVENVIQFIEKRHLIKERLLPGEPKFLDLFINELDEAGFLEPGTISRKKLTKRTKRALLIALKNFEKHKEKWQAEVSKTHEDWRF